MINGKRILNVPKNFDIESSCSAPVLLGERIPVYRGSFPSFLNRLSTCLISLLSSSEFFACEVLCACNINTIPLLPCVNNSPEMSSEVTPVRRLSPDCCRIFSLQLSKSGWSEWKFRDLSSQCWPWTAGIEELIFSRFSNCSTAARVLENMRTTQVFSSPRTLLH
jgi:hypothetical protein